MVNFTKPCRAETGALARLESLKSHRNIVPWVEAGLGEAQDAPDPDAGSKERSD